VVKKLFKGFLLSWYQVGSCFFRSFEQCIDAIGKCDGSRVNAEVFGRRRLPFSVRDIELINSIKLRPVGEMDAAPEVIFESVEVNLI